MFELYLNDIETIIQFFRSAFDLLDSTAIVIAETADRIDEIKFEDTAVFGYLGYAHNAMGTPLYSLFTSVCLISLGVTMWTYLLKGIGYIKNVLPW